MFKKFVKGDLVQTCSSCATRSYTTYSFHETLSDMNIHHPSFNDGDIGLVIDIKRNSKFHQNYFIKIFWNEKHIAWVHHAMIKKI